MSDTVCVRACESECVCVSVCVCVCVYIYIVGYVTCFRAMC